MDAHEAFEKVYEDHADALFRHCYFRVSNRERAVEITQDAFMKTWDHISRGTQIDNHKAFLFRVLNNLIIDEYRKKKSTSLDALLESEGVVEGQFDDLRTGSREETETGVDLSIESEHLHEALQELPEQYRQVVVMRYIDELGPKEIAQTLGESENAVSVRINRGVKKLQEVLSGTVVTS